MTIPSGLGRKNPDEDFILAAADLSGAAPRQWDEFLKQLDAAASRRRDDMVRAQPEALFVAQGVARGWQQLAEQLRACRLIAQNIRDLANAKANNAKGR